MGNKEEKIKRMISELEEKGSIIRFNIINDWGNAVLNKNLKFEEFIWSELSNLPDESLGMGFYENDELKMIRYSCEDFPFFDLIKSYYKEKCKNFITVNINDLTTQTIIELRQKSENYPDYLWRKDIDLESNIACSFNGKKFSDIKLKFTDEKQWVISDEIGCPFSEKDVPEQKETDLTDLVGLRLTTKTIEKLIKKHKTYGLKNISLFLGCEVDYITGDSGEDKIIFNGCAREISLKDIVTIELTNRGLILFTKRNYCQCFYETEEARNIVFNALENILGVLSKIYWGKYETR